MASTDNDLLQALALHYDDLVEHIRRRFSNQHFARDVVHDVCVQILEKPPLKAISVPIAFLRRATLNRAIDRRRAESTRLLYAQSQILGWTSRVPYGFPTSDDTVLMREASLRDRRLAPAMGAGP